ncbi:PD-(D/E)XK nuclease family protein [Patescibacteria group bacterium]|nr:PD-(D/E)XK nuclease family protein [Patescibacteria group bacterium]
MIKISRSKIDLFLECPRCFYLDKKLGITRPRGFPFTLNSAVDHLLKKEFDIHRAKGQPHPLMKSYGLDAVPFQHEKLGQWRHNFTGVQFLHEPTGFLIFGAIDDVWKDSKGKLAIVDYKATAKAGEINLDADWQIGYKRQMEIYQWLMRQNGFDVSDTGYFVYVNGKKDVKAFDAKLEFDVHLIGYKGDSSWVEGVIFEIAKTLESDKTPAAAPACGHCDYAKRAGGTG